MSDDHESPPPTRGVAEPVVGRRRGLPLVWVVPIVAAVLGLYLLYMTLSQRGPTITITFESANGVQAGKTPIKYRDVTLGVVKNVELAPDLSHVVVTAELQRWAAPHLREGTRFWIESAQLSAAGVTGLSTLLSGVYIGMLPGTGKPQRRFKGLDQPPVLQVGVPGRRFILHAKTLGSVSAGSPIYFRGIRVGEVLGYSLDPDAKAVSLFAFVRTPYDAFVRAGTHFWNASGIDVSMGAKGLQVHTQSLTSILAGGIAFDTPVAASAGTPSAENAEFPLYSSYEAIREGEFTQRVPFLVVFEGSVGGLEPGAPVLLRGLQIGIVREIHLEIDFATQTVRIPVVIELEPQRADLIGPAAVKQSNTRLARFIAKGLRAQLRTGSLLTGSQVVALDFFPKAPPAKLQVVDGLPEIPTVPSTTQELQEKASVFLDHLADAPIPQLVASLRDAAQSADRLLASQQMQQGLGELVESLRKTSDAAHATLQTTDQALSPDSALRYNLLQLIRELTQTSRSVRALSDTLQRDPNALIFGKKSSGGH
jgi:paraquat-inducible protein B